MVTSDGSVVSAAPLASVASSWKMRSPARMPLVGGRLSGSTMRSLRTVPDGSEAGIWTVTRLPGSASVLSMPVAVALTSVTAVGDAEGEAVEVVGAEAVDAVEVVAVVAAVVEVAVVGAAGAALTETLSMISSGLSLGAPPSLLPELSELLELSELPELSLLLLSLPELSLPELSLLLLSLPELSLPELSLLLLSLPELSLPELSLLLLSLGVVTPRVVVATVVARRSCRCYCCPTRCRQAPRLQAWAPDRC